MFVQLGGWLPAAPGGCQSRVELDAWREASEDTFPCLFRKLLTQSSRHANCVGNRKAASRPARASDLSVCVRARFRRASASSDSRSARVKRPGLTAPKPPGSPLARVTRVCWARSEPQALGLENSPRPRPRPRTAPPCLLAPPCGPRPSPAWPAVFSVSGGGGGGGGSSACPLCGVLAPGDAGRPHAGRTGRPSGSSAVSPLCDLRTRSAPLAGPRASGPRGPSLPRCDSRPPAPALRVALPLGPRTPAWALAGFVSPSSPSGPLAVAVRGSRSLTVFLAAAPSLPTPTPAPSGGRLNDSLFSLPTGRTL